MRKHRYFDTESHINTLTVPALLQQIEELESAKKALQEKLTMTECVLLNVLLKWEKLEPPRSHYGQGEGSPSEPGGDDVDPAIRQRYHERRTTSRNLLWEAKKDQIIPFLEALKENSTQPADNQKIREIDESAEQGLVPDDAATQYQREMLLAFAEMTLDTTQEGQEEQGGSK